VTDEECLKLITLAREQNNRLWMNVVRIALKHAPDEAKAVMKSIKLNDQVISALWGRIAEQ
jgi:hypothetical protein